MSNSISKLPHGLMESYGPAFSWFDGVIIACIILAVFLVILLVRKLFFRKKKEISQVEVLKSEIKMLGDDSSLSVLCCLLKKYLGLLYGEDLVTDDSTTLRTKLGERGLRPDLVTKAFEYLENAEALLYKPSSENQQPAALSATKLRLLSYDIETDFKLRKGSL